MMKSLLVLTKPVLSSNALQKQSHAMCCAMFKESRVKHEVVGDEAREPCGSTTQETKIKKPATSKSSRSGPPPAQGGPRSESLLLAAGADFEESYMKNYDKNNTCAFDIGKTMVQRGTDKAGLEGTLGFNTL